MNSKRNNESLVVLAYIAVCIIWGSTYLAMRIAVKTFPPELFAGIRFTLAGGAVLIFSAFKKYALPVSFKDCIKSALPGIFMLACANGLVMFAEQWVYSGITSLILSTTPLFIALIEFVFFKDKSLGLSGAVLLLAGFFGTAMLIMVGKGVGATDLKGGIMVFAASLFWAIGSIVSKRVPASGHLMVRIGIQMLAAGIILITVGVSTGELSKVQINASVIFSMLYLVILGSIVGYSSNMFVLSRWPASIAITSSYINPIVAVILGAVLVGETITPMGILFMLVVLVSVVGLHMKKYGMKLKAGRYENAVKQSQEAG